MFVNNYQVKWGRGRRQELKRDPGRGDLELISYHEAQAKMQRHLSHHGHQGPGDAKGITL